MEAPGLIAGNNYPLLSDSARLHGTIPSVAHESFDSLLGPTPLP